MIKVTTILLFILSLNSVLAQQKYWITFTDKDSVGYDYRQYLSEAAIQNRTQFGIPLYQATDVPVNKDYLNALSEIEIRPNYHSRWLNSISAYLDANQLNLLQNFDFVSSVSPIDAHICISSLAVVAEPTLVHIAMKQMQVNSFIEDSLTGKGVVIGVIDAGFFDAQSDKKLKHLFEENKIIEQKDFVSPERTDIITVKATDADSHGRTVLDMIAGYNSVTREMTGMAIDSKFYLARSEDGDREYRGEEDTWIAAMEWMDSKGVRLISTSLGYAIKMDKEEDNYTQAQMDGKTTKISQAAQIASDEKGIFLVVSAGNEGSNLAWQIISSPADAQGVLSVGATKSEGCERIEYSSIGPAFLPYLKPNVSCYSRNGTSFSAPAIAGFVSCLMQKAPYLDNKKLKEVVEKSGHLYPYGNNFIGYGVPKASRALKLLANPATEFSTAIKKEVGAKSITFKSSKLKQEATIFHKKNEFVVTDQTTSKFIKGKLKVRRPSREVVRTTVVYQEQVIEIFWK